MLDFLFIFSGPPEKKMGIKASNTAEVGFFILYYISFFTWFAEGYSIVRWLQTYICSRKWLWREFPALTWSALNNSGLASIRGWFTALILNILWLGINVYEVYIMSIKAYCNEFNYYATHCKKEIMVSKSHNEFTIT